MFRFIILFIASYLIGSIPTGLIFTKLLKGIDLRTIGSGNIGATNTMRVLGKPLGILVLVLDALKGVIGALILPLLLDKAIILWNFFDYNDLRLILGLAAIFGHIFSVYLNFKGGKGVATALGVFLATAPLPTLIAFAVAVPLIVITKYVSLGAIVGAIILPIAVAVIYKEFSLIFWVSLFMTIMVLVRHRGNIKRLIQGKENKI